MFLYTEQWLPPGWPCHCERYVCQGNWGAYLEHSGTLCSQISKDKKQWELQQQVLPLLQTGCTLPEESDLWRSCLWRCLHQATKLDLVTDISSRNAFYKIDQAPLFHNLPISRDAQRTPPPPRATLIKVEQTTAEGLFWVKRTNIISPPTNRLPWCLADLHPGQGFLRRGQRSRCYGDGAVAGQWQSCGAQAALMWCSSRVWTK